MYATEQDVLKRTDIPVELGDENLQMAVEDATAFIDGHLAGRYTLPLAEVPGILKSIAVDVAAYNLARDGGLLTDDIRQRFEDAQGYLRAVGKGSIKLPGQDDQPTQTGPSSASFTSAPRRFRRR